MSSVSAQHPIRLAWLIVLAGFATCTAEQDAEAVPATEVVPANGLAQALVAGRPAFGIRSDLLTAEDGARIGQIQNADVIFSSVESGP